MATTNYLFSDFKPIDPMAKTWPIRIISPSEKLASPNHRFLKDTKTRWAKFTVLPWLAAQDQDNSWEMDRNPDRN